MKNKFKEFIASYFIELKLAINEIDNSVFECISSTLNNQLYTFLCSHFIDFNKSLEFTLQKINKHSVDIPKYTLKSKIYNYVKTRPFFFKLYFLLHKIKSIFVKYNNLPKNYNFDIFSIIKSFSVEDIEILSEQIIEKNKTQIDKAFADLNSFNEIKGKKCILISTLFVSTWMPTFKELSKRGWSICSILKDDLHSYKGYGALTTNEIEIDKVYIHGLIGAILFAVTADKNIPVLFNGESYHGVHMFADIGVFMNLNLSCVTKVIRRYRDKENKNLYLFMYDGLKPTFINCAEVKQESSKYYARFLKTADRIIYNSNDEVFGEYVENAYGITVPRLYFGRYSVNVNTRNEKIDNEIHVVSITAIFDPTGSNARRTAQDMVRNIVEQGVHFHCYTGEHFYNQNLVEKFIKSIKPEFRKNFHLHEVIRDQVALVKELQQYDVGINGTDHLEFSKGILNLQDRRYSDGMMMYLQSTFATSFFVYAAAGLPILIPRCMTRATSYFGKFSIPVCLSDFTNIKNILFNVNLPKLRSEYKQLQQLGIVDNKIEKMENFLLLGAQDDNFSQAG